MSLSFASPYASTIDISLSLVPLKPSPLFMNLGRLSLPRLPPLLLNLGQSSRATLVHSPPTLSPTIQIEFQTRTRSINHKTVKAKKCTLFLCDLPVEFDRLVIGHSLREKNGLWQLRNFKN